MSNNAFDIEITDSCAKQFRKLNPEIQRRFYKKISSLAENPLAKGKPLRGELSGIWELYFEKSFRILYSVDNEKKKVLIESLKHKDDF